MTAIPDRLLHGTLDTLVLQALVSGPRHGYDVAAWIEKTSATALSIEDAALYTALHKLEEKGWVEAEWGISEKKKRAKFYHLTPAGRRSLEQRVREWEAYVRAVDRILRPSLTSPAPA
jgi:PadR family transcriptional regulator PadR